MGIFRRNFFIIGKLFGEETDSPEEGALSAAGGISAAGRPPRFRPASAEAPGGARGYSSDPVIRHTDSCRVVTEEG